MNNLNNDHEEPAEKNNNKEDETVGEIQDKPIDKDVPSPVKLKDNSS